MSFWRWSRTAADNATADSTVIAREGQAPSTVNNAMRGIMAAAAKFRDDVSANTATGGSSTAYTLATFQTFTAFATGMLVGFTVHATNGTPATLNVDSLGAKPLRTATGVAIVAGALVLGTPYQAVYNLAADEWRVLGVITPVPTDLPFSGIVQIATASILGRTTAAVGDIEVLTGTQATALLSNLAGDAGSGGTKGLAPAPASGDAAAGKVLGAGGTWVNQFTLATSVAASGTSVDFTGIPSGVNRVTIMLDQISTNGISALLIQIGDSGGIENTGYVAAATSIGGVNLTSAAGFPLVASSLAANNASGQLVLTRMTGSTWVCSGVSNRNDGVMAVNAGVKPLSATLDRVRLTTVNGTDTFDAGNVNIMYE